MDKRTLRATYFLSSSNLIAIRKLLLCQYQFYYFVCEKIIFFFENVTQHNHDRAVLYFSEPQLPQQADRWFIFCLGCHIQLIDEKILSVCRNPITKELINQLSAGFFTVAVSSVFSGDIKFNFVFVLHFSMYAYVTNKLVFLLFGKNGIGAKLMIGSLKVVGKPHHMFFGWADSAEYVEVAIIPQHL